MGDVVFKGFQCLNAQCENHIFVRADEITEFFEITCPKCDLVHQYGQETVFFYYDLIYKDDGRVHKSGRFTVLHDQYINEALEYKYCILCNTMKPLAFFSHHATRKSKHQGECRLCKTTYNSIKNQTRTTDQFREASQKRRLYVDLTTASGKIDSHAIYDRFKHRCFKCGKDLSADLQDGGTARGGNLDHTLPARYLWPLSTENATLLCTLHNGEKAESWPGRYYTQDELRKLVFLTGIPYETLTAEPHFNPEAIAQLCNGEFVEALFEKYAAYIDELILIRNRVKAAEGFDFFESSPRISEAWKRQADKDKRR